MSYKTNDDFKVRFCVTCETHFFASLEEHDDEHEDEDWAYFDGTWKEMTRQNRFKVDEELH